MRFPECLKDPTAQNTFVGVPAAQTWQDLALWEEFLNRHPIGSLIELGTWKGGMAAFLSFQCYARGIAFLTIDQHEGQVECLPLIRSIGGRFQAMDLLGPDAPARLESELRLLPKPVLLFCDNGNKRHELRTLTPLLSEGGYLAVHDWGSESGPEDVQSHWQFLMRTECEDTSSLTRFFRL